MSILMIKIFISGLVQYMLIMKYQSGLYPYDIIICIWRHFSVVIHRNANIIRTLAANIFVLMMLTVNPLINIT